MDLKPAVGHASRCDTDGIDRPTGGAAHLVWRHADKSDGPRPVAVVLVEEDKAGAAAVSAGLGQAFDPPAVIVSAGGDRRAGGDRQRRRCSQPQQPAVCRHTDQRVARRHHPR